MQIPYCIDLSKLNNPLWPSLPDGYSITYQPTGKGYSYFAWNDSIERSCRHFKEMIDNCFVAKQYATYEEAQKAILEHNNGCTEAFYPNSSVNIIVLPPIDIMGIET